MLVDAEHCFDPYYSKNLGVDVENLIVCQPDSGEMALESNTPLILFFLLNTGFNTAAVSYRTSESAFNRISHIFFVGCIL